MRAAEDLVDEADQAGALGVVRENMLEAVTRRAHPVRVEVTRIVDHAERLGQVRQDPEVSPRQGHASVLRSKPWRAMVRTAMPSGVARRAPGISPAPSTSRPVASASFVAVVSTICQANAVSASPQTSTTSWGPNGRSSVDAITPAGRASLPTAKRTRAG